MSSNVDDSQPSSNVFTYAARARPVADSGSASAVASKSWRMSSIDLCSHCSVAEFQREFSCSLFFPTSGSSHWRCAGPILAFANRFSRRDLSSSTVSRPRPVNRVERFSKSSKITWYIACLPCGVDASFSDRSVAFMILAAVSSIPLPAARNPPTTPPAPKRRDVRRHPCTFSGIPSSAARANPAAPAVTPVSAAIRAGKVMP